MNRKTIVVSLAALVIVAVGLWAVALRDATKTQNSSQTSGQTSSTESAKSDTEKKFETYVGEDYDRYFTANMIAHHQGAIDMAKLAQTNARHNELKEMANTIISTQTEEQTNMLSWQKAWGYPASSGEMMVDHSAMGMEEEMTTMMEQLKTKTGDDFDKAFLSSMIEHHTSAVDMSRPAAKNASHQEIKDLAKAIIEAQDAEIAQMRKWQTEWGYKS
jgi:uncharacterized protein (DUF305 family)